jgi:hypothetical protein
MADSTAAFTKMVPGFDFLQGLVKNAGAALPSVGQWIAPTLNPDELEKRIEELRTVQFWLEQNARMLGATIQALEVQRMTLSTLRTMNLSVGDLRDSMTLRVPESVSAPATEPKEAPTRKAPRKTGRSSGADQATSATPAAGVVDPMQWWSALTKQFTQLAATAMREGAADAAKGWAGSTVKPSIDSAEQPPKQAATMTPEAAAQNTASVAQPAADSMGGERKRRAPKRRRSVRP